MVLSQAKPYRRFSVAGGLSNINIVRKRINGETMVIVKEKAPNPLVKRARLLSRRMRDLWIVISLVLIISGFLLFQVSSLYPRTVQQQISTGSGKFTVAPNQNYTVYFATLHGQSTHVVVDVPAGTVLGYTIYSYNYVATQFIVHYYQNKVAQGTVDSAHSNIYLPISYADTTFFINVTLASGPSQTVNVHAYSNFYQVQKFLVPAEVAGVVLMVSGIIVLAVRITDIHSVQ